MEEKKKETKLRDIFFGKAGKVRENARLFLRFKKIEKIVEAEKKKMTGLREKLTELYGGENQKAGDAYTRPEKREAAYPPAGRAGMRPLQDLSGVKEKRRNRRK